MANPLNVIMLVNFAVGSILFTLIYRFYFRDWMHSVSRKEALTPFLLVHAVRYTGLAAMIPGIVSPEFRPDLGLQTALGDFASCLLALLALAALRLDWRSLTTPLLWIFNLVGFGDLLNAARNIRHIDIGHLGGLYLVPAVIVPALIVTHIIMFKLLIKPPASWTE